MILYVVTETLEKYHARNYMPQKFVLEDASRDLCLVAHYTQVNERMLESTAPWAICHSGASTPYEDFDILRHAAFRRVIRHVTIPQLGLCGGHQLIAMFFGSTVEPMRRLREADPDLNPKYHPGEFKEWGVYPVRIVRRDPLFRGLTNPFRAQEFHRSEIKKLGKPLTLLASSPDCTVQAFVHRSRSLYGVQFHPEEASADYPDGFRILKNFFSIARERLRARARR